MICGKVDKHALRQLQTPCRLSSANSNWLRTGATKIKNSSHISISMCFLLQLFRLKNADSESASCALCSAKDPLNQASWKRSALSPNTDSWNFGARKAVSEARGPPMLHIKKEGPQMTLPKLKSAWYSNCGCFSQGLCRIYWMVAGSAINRSVSVFNPIASIKAQKDICKTRLLAGEKAWPRLLRYFFKVGVEHRIAYLCRDEVAVLYKFVLVFYILLQGCLLWSPSCCVAAKFKEERRERYLLFSFPPLPFCWISRWRPKKIQTYS